MNKTNFWFNLQVARSIRNLTQAELSKLSKLHPSSISHFERGKREPSLHNLVRLCRALNCSADYLLGLNKNDDMNNFKLNKIKEIIK